MRNLFPKIARLLRRHNVPQNGHKPDDPEFLRKIWWIASYPKSGNTLVRMFLNAYVTRFPLDLNAHYQYACIDQQIHLYQRVTSKPVTECHPVEILYLRPSMLMTYIHDIAPRDACFKTHMAAGDFEGIPLIPPRLTKEAVYLARDPRDVAVSYARHCGTSIDEIIAVMASDQHVGNRHCAVKDYILSWSKHVDSWLGIKAFPVHLVRFEDMIADREKAFRQILPALGFRRIDEAAFGFAMEQTEFENLQRLEREKGFREAKRDKFFHTGRAGQWQDVLTSKQVERIETGHREQMTRVGYQPSIVGVP